MHLVYVATNTVNGKRYIGMTSRSIKERFKEHVNDSNSRPKNRFLRAVRKYGIKSFKIEVICREKSRLAALESEILLILDREPEYNSTLGGEGGQGFPPDVREKIGATFRGKKLSTEHCEKIAASKRGKPRSAETIEKMRSAATGRTHSELTKQKLSALFKGRTHTLEAREKIASSKRGIPRSLDTRTKLSEAHKGKKRGPYSLERNKKISEAKRGKKFSEAHRRALLAAWVERKKKALVAEEI